MNTVKLVIGAATDVGKVREVNEDAQGFVSAGVGDVFVVCDGMGGHAAGEIASQLARDTMLHTLVGQGPGSDPETALRAAIQAAQEAVRGHAAANPERHGMGTTCTIALIRDGVMTAANVGDSRIYVLGHGGIEQVSRDHTKAQELVDHGIISPQEAETHPDKGVLAQALGQQKAVEPFIIGPRPLLDGDLVLLATDGVFDMVPDGDIARIVETAQSVGVSAAAQALVDHAVQHDGKDNTTVILVRHGAVPPPRAAARVRPKTKEEPVPAAFTAPLEPTPPPRSRAGLLLGLAGALIGAIAGASIATVLADDAECRRDQDCAKGQLCDQGRCEADKDDPPGCRYASDCGDNERCDSKSGACIAVKTPPPEVEEPAPPKASPTKTVVKKPKKKAGKTAKKKTGKKPGKKKAEKTTVKKTGPPKTGGADESATAKGSNDGAEPPPANAAAPEASENKTPPPGDKEGPAGRPKPPAEDTQAAPEATPPVPIRPPPPKPKEPSGAGAEGSSD